MIQNAANLSLSKGQLRLRNEDGEFTLPIEDITAIILESPQITLSSSLLSACQNYGLAVITCDDTHMPNGVLLPFQQHSRQTKVAHLQASMTEGLKARLWQRIVKVKITNQAACLEKNIGKEQATRLYALARRVDVGDAGNIEAQAARDYWPRLLKKDFRRSGTDINNAALNYGYAVLRAFVARSQVAYGLLPTFGIHHSNQLNAFNLTDDMMEVLRPFVDDMVCELKKTEQLEQTETKLPSIIRQDLANIGNIKCRIEGQVHTIANACDKMAAGLVSAIENKTPALMAMPEFLIKSDLEK